ncbi:MAG: excalibur calcium-binding domain-containing protein [Alphaproteobacteria bacterium]|nr:excalibur calcium-binding domain-containing protein [Alphaproteobacteria bacterium]
MRHHRPRAASAQRPPAGRLRHYDVRWTGDRFEVVTRRAKLMPLLRRGAGHAMSVVSAARGVLYRMRRLAWAGLGASVTCAGIMVFSPWPFTVTLRHIAAIRNCDAARAVGLAPARRGDPGYWPHLDRDKDGWACEPLPRHNYRSD